MRHMMRAEYEDGGSDDAGRRGPVKIWHMVRGTAATAMCGRELDVDAETRPEDDFGRPDVHFCHSCGALYLREVPSTPV